jgi:hypothetical protein
MVKLFNLKSIDRYACFVDRHKVAQYLVIRTCQLLNHNKFAVNLNLYDFNNLAAVKVSKFVR